MSGNAFFFQIIVSKFFQVIRSLKLCIICNHFWCRCQGGFALGYSLNGEIVTGKHQLHILQFPDWFCTHRIIASHRATGHYCITGLHSIIRPSRWTWMFYECNLPNGVIKNHTSLPYSRVMTILFWALKLNTKNI